MKDDLVWIHLDSQSMPWGSFSTNFLTNSERKNFPHYFKINVWAFQFLSAIKVSETENGDTAVHIFLYTP